jgi:hypothetical protein
MLAATARMVERYLLDHEILGLDFDAATDARVGIGQKGQAFHLILFVG